MTTDDTLGAAGPAGARSENRCLEWVKRVGFVMSALCPVYLKQQTLPDLVGTSHLCQQRPNNEMMACVAHKSYRGQRGDRGEMT
jgi:hypothetical protein